MLCDFVKNILVRNKVLFNFLFNIHTSYKTTDSFSELLSSHTHIALFVVLKVVGNNASFFADCNCSVNIVSGNHSHVYARYMTLFNSCSDAWSQRVLQPENSH